jgi:NADPH-dependent 2,4-dienoyl-CoA reductase/sulfur reductase-like enzyme
VALLLIVLIPTGMLSWGDHFGWVTLLNLPLLGLPLLYGAGAIPLDDAIAAAFRRRFPRFEGLPATAVAGLPHVIILGGGFGGLAAARGLRYAACRVTLLDQHNYHLFQPLLYQVATAWLSPADIATPLREMFRAQANLRVLLGEVTKVDPALRQIALGKTRLAYDFLIIATGARHSYFGHDNWAPAAPGLKGSRTRSTFGVVFCLPSRRRRAVRTRRSGRPGSLLSSSAAARPASNRSNSAPLALPPSGTA